MSLPEDRSWETGKSQVANMCGVNGVEGAGLIIFWRVSDCHRNLTR